VKRAKGKNLIVAWGDKTVGLLHHTGPIYFTYDSAWIASRHNLSPILLPFDGRAHNIIDEGCHGLPGFIADALPDAWGTRVAEAVFAQNDWGAVTPMKLLAWISDRAPGALSFRPALEKDGSANDLLGRITAERLAQEAEDILRGKPEEIAAIAAAGGSAGGAHPKALVIEHADGSLSVSHTPSQPEDRSSLLKLGLPEQPSVRVEHAYLAMARAAGITVTPFRLIEGAARVHLLIERFDWTEGRRLHLHSLSGLLHRPKSGLDYSDLIRAAARLGQSRDTVVEIARRLLFNLYAANNDDHGRNHAFLYDQRSSTWRLAPAFDLTYSPGVLSRGLTIAGEVSPNAATLVAFLKSAALSESEIRQLSEQVLVAIAEWPEFARGAGVSDTKTAEIKATHDRLLSRIEQP
jgi:serine/threonine-protein kinase HipA